MNDVTCNHITEHTSKLQYAAHGATARLSHLHMTMDSGYYRKGLAEDVEEESGFTEDVGIYLLTTPITTSPYPSTQPLIEVHTPQIHMTCPTDTSPHIPTSPVTPTSPAHNTHKLLPCKTEPVK